MCFNLIASLIIQCVLLVLFYLPHLHEVHKKYPRKLKFGNHITAIFCSQGYFISCAASSVAMALTVGPTFIVPFILFGGYFLNVTSIPIYLNWLSYVSWFRYGYESLQINQWTNVTDIVCNSRNATCARTGGIVLEMYNFQPANFYFDIAILVFQILLFRTLGFVSLLIKTYTLD